MSEDTPEIPRGLSAAEIQKQINNARADFDLRKWCVTQAMTVVNSPGVTAPAENGISTVATDIYNFITAGLRDKPASPEK